MTAIDSGLLPSDDAEALTDLWFIVRSHDADGAEGVTVDLVYNGALFTASTADLTDASSNVIGSLLAPSAAMSQSGREQEDQARVGSMSKVLCHFAKVWVI